MRNKLPFRGIVLRVSMFSSVEYIQEAYAVIFM